jgi:predicted DNA-binding transcriptional regulator AlpA
MSNRYLTEKEVSEITRISVQTLRNDRFNRRNLPYYKIGKSVRYSWADINDFMKSRRIEISFISGNLKAAKGGVKV